MLHTLGWVARICCIVNMEMYLDPNVAFIPVVSGTGNARRGAKHSGASDVE